MRLSLSDQVARVERAPLTREPSFMLGFSVVFLPKEHRWTYTCSDCGGDTDYPDSHACRVASRRKALV